MYQEYEHVHSKADEQKQEPAMVLVTQTVVHKDAMVIELLHTTITEIAVLGILWSQVFTIDAHIIKMVAFGLNSLKDVLKVWLFIYVTRIHERQNVENHSS